jgi:DMSO/TMAO reductase YedYZ molybdopterin-dependent catalytic subunit
MLISNIIKIDRQNACSIMEESMLDLKTVISPDTLRKQRLPPGQHLTEKWPVLHYGAIPKIETAKLSFKIFGLVDRVRILSYTEFLTLPLLKVFSDIHCVTTWSRLDNLWEGVSTGELKKLVQIDPRVRFVIVHASGNFTTNLTIEDFFQPDVLFAFKHNNETISADHGGPVRLVVPRLYFWKSAKWVNGIEFTENDKPGFWESNGYHNHGDPWKEERYG